MTSVHETRRLTRQVRTCSPLTDMGFVEDLNAFSYFLWCVIATARICSESWVRMCSAPGADTGRDPGFLVCAGLSGMPKQVRRKHSSKVCSHYQMKESWRPEWSKRLVKCASKTAA